MALGRIIIGTEMVTHLQCERVGALTLLVWDTYSSCEVHTGGTFHTTNNTVRGLLHTSLAVLLALF